MKSGSSFERDGKFSRYDANGDDNPVWKGKPILELLQAVLLDTETTKSQKERATSILAYVARKRKWFLSTHPELDAYEGLLRFDAMALWDFYPDWQIVTEKDEERVCHIEPEEIVTSTAKSSEQEVELQQEPEQDESELSGEQKLQRAREQTRGMLPSLNF
jgi:hypothetical protein